MQHVMLRKHKETCLHLVLSSKSRSMLMGKCSTAQLKSHSSTLVRKAKNHEDIFQKMMGDQNPASSAKFKISTNNITRN